MSTGTADVDTAYGCVGQVVTRTPLQPNLRLAERCAARAGAAGAPQVWLKREDLQPVRSYKLRGAYNMLAKVAGEDRRRPVVCASAGNHAQGVAYACRRLEMHARVFVPRTTPRQKRDRIRALGGDAVEVIVGGDTYDAAKAAAQEEAARTGAVVVPAFDHPEVIAGQGTVVREIVEQLGRAPDVLVVPVGGGGLLAGTTTWLSQHHPSVRVVGVEPSGAAGMAAALKAGGPVTLDALDGFVDGAAVRRVGDATYDAVRDRDVDLVEVDPGVVCEEMLDLFQVDGIIAEPAGALATSAVRSYVPAAPGETVVAVLSGGNHDVSRYADVIERSLVSKGLKHYFLVEFPQEPGALRSFLDDVLGPDDDITLFEYVKRHNRETGPALVGIELGNAADLPGLLSRFAASPVHSQKLSPDDPAFHFLV